MIPDNLTPIVRKLVLQELDTFQELRQTGDFNAAKMHLFNVLDIIPNAILAAIVDDIHQWLLGISELKTRRIIITLTSVERNYMIRHCPDQAIKERLMTIALTKSEIALYLKSFPHRHGKIVDGLTRRLFLASQESI